MVDSGVVSSFNFRAFKLDSLMLDMKPELSVLESQPTNKQEWELKLKIRPPMYLEKDKVYVVGIDCLLTLHEPGVEKKRENALLFLETGAVGSFGVSGEKFEQKIEDNIVRIQMPALLFSHIRAAITNILACSGFGSVLLPLINVHNLVKKSPVHEMQIISE